MAIRILTQYKLFQALVYVYVSVGDYVSPLELLIGECSRLLKVTRQSFDPDAGRLCPPYLDLDSLERKTGGKA